MSRHARIEEISEDSESDPMEMDPSDFEPSSKYALSPARSSSTPSMIDPRNIPSSSSSSSFSPSSAAVAAAAAQNQYASAADLERFKHFQCLYPVYFDTTRSRAEGRRVGKESAVENPLARDIVDAVQGLGLRALFEPGKVHPRDWSNPGRVKVLIKQDGRAVNPKVKNKSHLYLLVGQYLRAHPSTEASAQRLRVPGLPPPDPNKPAPPLPAIPRGWKMGTILPLHSPALSGGGISDNFFKDIMAEMQGQGGGADGGTSSGAEAGGGKKKKDKTKNKA
ncbi:MAG: signal recognition particle subunit [Peltula sp. TS41687]|nr:MAG: signal recognition particle subunit [Peltula sp. TS41687]